MLKKMLCAALLLLSLVNARADSQSFLSIHYQPLGDSVGNDVYYTLTFPSPQQHLILNTNASSDDVSWLVDVNGGPGWSGGFASGDGSTLSPGEYTNTTSQYLNPPVRPYLALSYPGINLGDTPTGSFHIYELSRLANGLPSSFAATFSLHAVDGPATLTGALWYNSAVPFPAPVPEPATYAMMGLGLGLLGLVHRKRAAANYI